MNNTKRIKPNLVDPIIEKKIIKTLAPPKEDYWAPTKNGFQTFYQTYIKPNMAFVIFILLVIVFLIYRYHTVKKDRKRQELENIMGSSQNNNQPINNVFVNNRAINTSVNNTLSQKNTSVQNQNSIPKKEVDEYAKLLLSYYNQQKEISREPLPKTNLTRHDLNPNLSPHTNKVNLAYPMYPYTSGGSLIPSGGR